MWKLDITTNVTSIGPSAEIGIVGKLVVISDIFEWNFKTLSMGCNFWGIYSREGVEILEELRRSRSQELPLVPSHIYDWWFKFCSVMSFHRCKVTPLASLQIQHSLSKLFPTSNFIYWKFLLSMHICNKNANN